MKAGIAIEQRKTLTLQRAAMIAKRHLEDSRDRATGGDGRLSGVGKSGAKLGVTFTMRGGSTPEALMRATGPWQLVEENTSAHVIAPRRAQAIAFGGLARASAHHPGTRGKKPWATGSAAAHGPTTAALRQELSALVKAVL